MYCFNTDCNMWGEPQPPRWIIAIWPGQGTGTCVECGGVTVVHDNWNQDLRTHDDGTPVTEQ